MPSIAAVETPVLELIKSLQSRTYLRDFYLVGGTALALHLRHRRSVDIDLFSNFSFDASALLEQLQQDFTYTLFHTGSNTLKGSILKINVDILAHRYRLIDQPREIQGVTLLSERDIIAMKLNAIATSGQRSKDFIDIYFLLETFPLSNMLESYKAKYGRENISHILKSLIYFDEVDLVDWPFLIREPTLKWDSVKKRIEKAVLDYIRGQNSTL